MTRPAMDISGVILMGALGCLEQFGWTNECIWVLGERNNICGAIWQAADAFGDDVGPAEARIERFNGAVARIERYLGTAAIGFWEQDKPRTEQDVLLALENAADGRPRCRWTGDAGQFECLWVAEDGGPFCSACNSLEAARAKGAWIIDCVTPVVSL